MNSVYASDGSLRVFVLASRLGSFTAAADELGMTQPAVSHSIKRLETAIGERLLHRSRTGVRPTVVGEELLSSVAPAFEAIDRAVAAAAGHARDAAVSISVSTSLATWWLLPRLPEFKRQHPDVELRLVSTDTDDHIDMASLDLWIPLGLVERPDLEATRLCDETLVPVASPELAATLRADDPSALTDAPLLHLEERYQSRFDWPAWFRSQGVSPPDKLRGDRLTDYSLVIHAALAAQGVALGWLHLVSDLLADGRLVAMGPATTTDHPFNVLHRKDAELRPGADAFRRWITDEMPGSIS